MKPYAFSSLLFSVVGAFLVAQSVRLLRANGGIVLNDYLMLCFGTVGLFLGVRGLIRLSSGKVLFELRRSVPLNGGELTFAEPDCPYEVWLFCEVPFSRYHGTISVKTSRTGAEHVIRVPRRNPWLWWFWRPRSDSTPVVWRSPSAGSSGQNQCYIMFQLLSTFLNTMLHSTYPTHERESVTVVVKAVGRFRR